MSEATMEVVFDTRTSIGHEEIAVKRFPDDPKNDKSMTNFQDHNRQKILDEDFRLAVENLPIGLTDLPNNWADMAVREQRDWVSDQVRKSCTNLPESLQFVILGNAIDGDCGRAPDAVPEWLDRQKFQRGQRFVMDNYVGVAFSEMISLHMLFSIDYALKPLIVTGRSSEPFTSFKRYLSTVRRVRNWYSTDVWTKGTAGYEDIQIVRSMHANIRSKLRAWGHEKVDEAAIIRKPWSPERARIREDFRSSCQAPAPGHCPLMFTQEAHFKRPNALNQAEMALTQFGFMGLIILYPEKFGIHDPCDEDIEAFCHLWRGLGFLLGIEDEFNVCRGSVQEVKQRARDSIDYWIRPNLRQVSPEWEHMMRCVTEGISYYLPRVTYEISLLFFADVLEIPMPRLHKSISFISRIRFYLLKFSLRYTSRIPGVMKRLNRRVHRYVDRALSFTDEELARLERRSEATMAKGIADTVRKSSTKVHRAAPFFVFVATFFLLNLPIIIDKIPGQIDPAKVVCF